MSALSTVVTFLMSGWLLILGFFLFTFAVLAASCIGGLKSNWMSWSAGPRVKTSWIMCSVWSTFLSQFGHFVVNLHTPA